MGLFEEAVDAALEMTPPNLDLAKDIANSNQDDEDMRKKLWLRIAKTVVDQERQIGTAIAFLHQSKLLKIEDILPFFPEFTTVDDFKNDICSSLRGYNQHLDRLHDEMKEATETAELIREDIKQIRENYVIVDANQICESCKYPIMTRSFYVFPCSHCFHSECLRDLMLPHLTPAQQTILTTLESRLRAIENPNEPHSQPEKSLVGLDFNFKDRFAFFDSDEENEHKHRDPVESIGKSGHEMALSMGQEQDIKDQIDNLVAYECILCNQIMIDSLDTPFVDPKNVDINDTWKVPNYEGDEKSVF